MGERVREHADLKFGKLTKVWTRIISVEAELHEEANARVIDRHLVDITAKTPLGTLRSSGKGVDFFVAIDQAIARLEAQLKKTKTRRQEASHRGPRPEPTNALPLDGLVSNQEQPTSDDQANAISLDEQAEPSALDV